MHNCFIHKLPTNYSCYIIQLIKGHSCGYKTVLWRLCRHDMCIHIYMDLVYVAILHVQCIISICCLTPSLAIFQTYHGMTF